MADIINVEVQEENETPIVFITVDENSAQTAIDAVEAAQDILDQINDLVLPDEIIHIEPIIKVGNVRKIPIGAEWRLDGLVFTNTSIFEYTVNPATPGLNRIDRTVANKFGSFQYLIGVPGAGVVEAPDVPDATINVTLHYVFGENVNDDVPVTGGLYVEKEESLEIVYNGSGIVDTIDMSSKRSVVRFPGSFTLVKSIQHNAFTLMRHGQPYFFHVDQNNPITLGDPSGNGNLKFDKPRTFYPGDRPMYLMNRAALKLEFVGVEKSKTRTITTNTTLDNSFDDCILLIKANCTITIPLNIYIRNFVATTFIGVTATFANAVGVTKSSPNGFILQENKMCSVFGDGANNYVFRGELSV